MKFIKILPLEYPISKEIILPGSLSYTIRAMALAAMTEGRVKIDNALKSDDTYAMFQAFKTLGIRTEEGQDFFVIEGSLRDVKEAGYEINIGLSGRSARTLLAMLCLVPGTKILTCAEAFKKRPVGDLVDGLRQMGAEIEYLEKQGFLPVKIISSKLKPGKIKLKGEISSQFVSAILMIAPLVGEVEIEIEGEQASKSFIDMTIEAMKSFRVEVVNNNYREYLIKGGQEYRKETYFVEPDATAASYFWSVAALTKSKIKVLHLSPNSKQGDVSYADTLGRMGCLVRRNMEDKCIEVEGPNYRSAQDFFCGRNSPSTSLRVEHLSSKKSVPRLLKGINVDMNNNLDVVQTLAVTAAFAEGKTIITGIGNLRVKETDRIEATRRELEKMGVHVESGSDFLKVTGGGAHGAEIDTYGDHRMAMAFAVAGARIPGMIINNPGVVSKSFPGFWKKLEEIGVRLGNRV